MSTGDYKLIDGWANMPISIDKRLVPYSPAVARWFKGQQQLMKTGATVDDLISDMDAAGVEKALVCARFGWGHPETRPVGPLATSYGMHDDIFDEFCQEAAAGIAKYPDRLYGTAVIDPMGGMVAVRQLERTVNEYGFVACRIFPGPTNIGPDHPLCYPIYTKCIELGIPVTVNLGAPGPRRPARYQRPMLLEEVLLAFPELTVVGTHIGHPWHHETVALLQKHPNFFLMTSGWAPKYVPSEIIHFLNTRGQRQVMWASDYPLISIARAVKEGWELELREEARVRYLRENCIEVFGLNKSGKRTLRPTGVEHWLRQRSDSEEGRGG